MDLGANWKNTCSTAPSPGHESETYRNLAACPMWEVFSVFLCFSVSDPVCVGDLAYRPVLLHQGLPLPLPHFHLHHRPLWPPLPLPLHQLLVPRLHQGPEAPQGPAERGQWSQPQGKVRAPPTLYPFPSLLHSTLSCSTPKISYPFPSLLHSTQRSCPTSAIPGLPCLIPPIPTYSSDPEVCLGLPVKSWLVCWLLF